MRLHLLPCALLLAVFMSSAVSAQSYDPEARLRELGLELPASNPPVANYVPAVRTGNLVFLSGAIPRDKEGNFIRGRLGESTSIEEGYAAARVTTLLALSALKAEIGDLRKVRRIVRVDGLVSSTPDFTQQSAVVNGASDLLGEVFGERGRHARTAVGMAVLPMGVPVEIVLIVEVE